MAVVWVSFQKKHVIFLALVYLSDIGRRVAILAGGACRHAYCGVPIPHPELMAMEFLMIDIHKGAPICPLSSSAREAARTTKMDLLNLDIYVKR